MLEFEKRLDGLGIRVTWPAAPEILLVTTTSGRELFVNGAATMAPGEVPAPGSSSRVMMPLPRSTKTLTVFAPVFVTAIPPLPCPKKSAMATPEGVRPVLKGDCKAAAKVPSPLPSSTLSVLSAWLTTARAGPMLPLNVPEAMATGNLPTEIGEPLASVNVPSPLPRRMEMLFVV